MQSPLLVLSKIVILGLVILSLAGCPMSMEPSDNALLLKNNSSLEIKVLLNMSYPDSSLHRSLVDRYLDPRSSGYVGSYLLLRQEPGLTVLIFDSEYFSKQWHEHVGQPDTYLAEDRILRRYTLSRRELERVDWTLVYP